MSTDLAQFEKAYSRHVAMVQGGDLEGVMADMHPDALPTVFQGVDVPRGSVLAAEVRAVRVVDGRGIGECVYTTPRGRIGLRSGWTRVGAFWKADALENFDA
jgi:hypothetical protein